MIRAALCEAGNFQLRKCESSPGPPMKGKNNSHHARSYDDYKGSCGDKVEAGIGQSSTKVTRT